MTEFETLNESTFDSVEALWRELYVHQAAHGMLLAVPEDGFTLWAQSLKPLLGRFACLDIAKEDGQPIGFVAGRVRSLPPQFGGGFAGFISEIYVADAWRGQGLGRRLMDRAMSWFQSQGMRRVELQVLSANDEARAAYRRWGWVEELVQMVYEIK